MKIIITGATGSLGAYLTRWYSARGHEVIAIGRTQNPPARLKTYARYIMADITRPYTLPPADVCIHTAGLANDKSVASDLHAINVVGTYNTIIAAHTCQMFVHISSSSVYPHSSEPLKEEMACEISPRLSPYGKSKWQAEEIVRKNFRNGSCFILRPRGLYGAGDKVLLPKLLRLVRHQTMIRPGAMNVRLSMTHFSNFAAAVEGCLASGLSGIHTYNVADDKTYLLYDVVKALLLAVYGRELEERNVPVWMLRWMSRMNIGGVTPLFVETVSKDLALDLSKIKRELRYSPIAHLEGCTREIASWVNAVGGIDVVKAGEARLAWES